MNHPAQPEDLQRFLNEVEKTLDGLLSPGQFHQAQGETLVAGARHLCLSGGKRARPMLARLFGLSLGIPSERMREIGVAAELIHSASLLHDDVVDSGMFRRGKPTVNARWGNIVAVMSGDLLLSSGLAQLAPLDPEITRRAILLVGEMTRGAIAEVEARGDLGLPQEQLRFIAEAKTGALFGWSGAAAALIAQKPEHASRLDAFGRHLGVAFQIADDVRDITGADEGKPQYADLTSRTPSLPILLAVQKDPSLRRRLRDAWAFNSIPADRVRELGSAVFATGALDESVAMLHRELALARAALGPFAQTPGGEELLGWADVLAASVALRGAA